MTLSLNVLLGVCMLSLTLPIQAGPQDFDFLLGRWQGHSKRLVQRFAQSNDWEQFQSTHDGRRMLNGLGIEDDFRTEHWPGFVGQSMQVYNPATQLWSVYWIDNRDYKLSPPVMGAFKNGVGVFEGDDVLNGVPIRVRYVWSNISATGARWEQSFSNDGGKRWELNWIMEFRRE